MLLQKIEFVTASRDKTPAGKVSLSHGAGKFHEPVHPRAEPARKLREVFLRHHFRPMEEGPVKEMLGRAARQAGPGGLVVVSGSLFVAAEGLRALGSTPLPQQEEAGSQNSG